MNIKKFASYLRDSNLKHGKFYASLVCKWYLLVAMPILFVSIAMAYLYSQPTKYVATATFGKVNNLDEGINFFITKYVKSSELIKKSVLSNCVTRKDNLSQQIYINNVDIINEDKNNFTVQLSISGKNINNVSACANLFFSEILNYQIKTYKNYNEDINIKLTEFEKSLNNKFLNLPNGVISEILKMDMHRFLSEKKYNYIIINNSIDMVSKYNGFPVKITGENSLRNKIMISSVLFGLLIAVLVAARKELLLYVNSLFNLG